MMFQENPLQPLSGSNFLHKNLIYICFVLAQNFGTDCKFFLWAQSIKLGENLYIHIRMYH